MKLKELLEREFKDGPKIYGKHPTETVYVLKGKELDRVKEELMSCDEFLDVEDIVVSSNATTYPLTMSIVKLTEDIRFNKILYLNEISLTSTLYSPEDFNIEIKDGCSISPVLYSQEDFIPYKKISIKVNVESLADYKDEYRKELHLKLDDMLDNKSEYELKGVRGVLIRFKGSYDVSEKSKSINVVL